MIKPENVLLATEMKAIGGRDGKVTSPDGTFQLNLTIPKELGGPGGSGTNPEQLFAAGYAACFLGAVKLVARTNKITAIGDITVTAKVGIGPVALGYALTVELAVEMPGVAPDIAKQVVAGAHERCPYSKATRGNIDVQLRVV